MDKMTDRNTRPIANPGKSHSPILDGPSTGKVDCKPTMTDRARNMPAPTPLRRPK